MADYGLLGGIGQGLQAGFQTYMAERKHQEDTRSNALAKALQAKLGGVQLDSAGTGYDDTPETSEKNRVGLLKLKAEGDEYDPLSQTSKNRQGFVKGLLGQAGVNQGLIGDNMSSHDIGENEKYLSPVITGEYGLKKEREQAKKEKSTKVPTDSQFNAAMFGKRSEEADRIIQEIGDYRATATGAVDAKAPGLLMSGQAKKIDQAERNFVNSILRRESGAAISSSEFENAEKQYFPRVGDPPDVIKQKAQNRAQAILGLQAASNEAWEKVPTATGPLQRNGPKPGMVGANIVQGGIKPVHKMSREELLREAGGT